MDQRMLEVMEYCVINGTNGVVNHSDWMTRVGGSGGNISNIRVGHQSFTKDQMRGAGLAFNVNMEFLFGFSNEMFRYSEIQSAIDMLKAAVKAVEIEYADSIKSNGMSNKR